MNYDINEIKITGTVEQFCRIPTRTGTPMIKISVTCYKEHVSVVAFKDLAESVELEPGDRVEVMGQAQSTSWTDKEGNKRYGWQIVAKEINPLVDGVQEQRPMQQPVPIRRSRQEEIEQSTYQGGPF